MYMYVCIYIYIYIYIRIYVYVYMYMYRYPYIFVGVDPKAYPHINYALFFRVLYLTCIHCQRRVANRSELAVESFFPQSYGKSKQRNISEAINFLDFDHGTRNIFFQLFNRYP